MAEPTPGARRFFVRLLQRADEAGVSSDAVREIVARIGEADNRRATGEDVYVQADDGTLIEDLEDLLIWLDWKRDARLAALRGRQHRFVARGAMRQRTAKRRRDAALARDVADVRREHAAWSDATVARLLVKRPAYR